MNLYVVGTWLGVYFVVGLMERVLNDKFDEGIYDMVAGAGIISGVNLAIYTYISHFAFVVIAVRSVVMPLEMPLTFGLITTFVLT